MNHHQTRIGIIGGGPGGLTLARLLAARGVPSAVFELDEHPLARPQGGSLDLHAESGQLALREAGLEAQFRALARYDDQGDAIYDHRGVLRFAHDGEGGDRPEIDRTQLRAILLDSLPEGTVRWGSKVSGVVQASGDRYRVMGPEGALGEFDLVVGADGAWSKVRPLVSSARPAYLGLFCFELTLDDVDTRHPTVAALLPRGKISAIEDNRGFIAQRSSGGQVRVYWMFREPDEQRARGLLDLSSPARARADLRALHPGWAPELLAFVDACNDTITPRPIVALPTGHRWAHRPGVTLLGDAAHVMSPFSGEGVNMAMLDALDLARALAASADWSEAVAGFEERMFARAASAADAANQAASVWPQHVLTMFADDAHATPSAASTRATPRELFETHIAEKTRDPATRKAVNGSFRFDLSGPDGGTWIVDFQEGTAGVRQADEASSCVIAMRDADFVAMVAGDFTPRLAFMRGQLKLQGDMLLAMKLGHVLSA